MDAVAVYRYGVLVLFVDPNCLTDDQFENIYNAIIQQFPFKKDTDTD